VANWNVALNWLLDNEDFKRAYKVVPDAPPGAFAVSGINSAAFPQDFDAISKMMISERGVAVQAFYFKNFWNGWFAQLVSDAVAKRVFDMAVNGGAGTAVKLLQRAVNSFTLSDRLVVDGGWGPRTVAAVNAISPLTLIEAFQQQRIAHYVAIVEANPADAKYLAGWLARARK
jgi:lysozyme family protein